MGRLAFVFFMMQSIAHAASCPQNTIEFSDFCMDQFEAPNTPGERPLTGKTAFEGEAWCASQGKDLCDEEQWMTACGGSSGRPFPYGDRYERGRCNDDKTWIPPGWGAIATYPAEAGRAEIDRLNQSDASGSRSGCSTPEGVMDLTGNVAEWVKATRPHPNGHPHVLKGCYWSGCYGGAPPSCGFVNPAHPGAFRTYEAGFRCCQRKEPRRGPASAPPCDASEPQYPNGGLVESAGDPGCPDGMARVSSVCIDRYEASLEELTAEGPRQWSPFHNPGRTRVRARSLEGAIPQGYINADQAEAACRQAGKRLCTSDEWLSACRGSEGRTYPYGGTRYDGLCNDSRRRHPAVELFPRHPDPYSMINNACINQLPDSLGPTGARSGCRTPEGVYDLMGNLHEWVADADGTFRGGYYVDTRINGEGCLYRTTAHSRRHWDYSTGFRCCASPTR
jgi:formylglycine-generating enzyme required for sulfatase activity